MNKRVVTILTIVAIIAFSGVLFFYRHRCKSQNRTHIVHCGCSMCMHCYVFKKKMIVLPVIWRNALKAKNESNTIYNNR